MPSKRKQAPKKSDLSKKKIAVIALVAGVVMTTALSLQAIAAGSTIVVTQINETATGWNTTQVGGTIEYVNAEGALGEAALQFKTTNEGSYTRYVNNVNNVPLTSVGNLSYRTKQISPTQSNAAAHLRLYVDLDGDGMTDDELVYEPFYNGALTSNWQTWSITQSSGLWWSKSGRTYNGKGGVSGGSTTTNFTLSDVVAEDADVQVDQYGLGTGPSMTGWTVLADALKVNDTTYNFEINEPTVPLSVNDCKENGWEAFGFKNQGQCVSFVTSNTNANKR